MSWSLEGGIENPEVNETAKNISYISISISSMSMRMALFRPVMVTVTEVWRVSTPKGPFSLSFSNSRCGCHRSTPDDQEPPQEAVLKLISEVSKNQGRVGQTTNMVIGGTVSDDSTNEWLALDHKVNTYPTARGFTAIGTGGDDFVKAMVIAVESVLQHSIPQAHVKQKISSGGKYVSVNIGPVQVLSSQQVQAVYNAMRRDVRMKYFL